MGRYQKLEILILRFFSFSFFVNFISCEVKHFIIHHFLFLDDSLLENNIHQRENRRYVGYMEHSAMNSDLDVFRNVALVSVVFTLKKLAEIYQNKTPE